ncbi:MAG: hypothetical protein RKP46_11045 [Candidatus Accumulibacter sp.]|uniref:hypothetical protein n=1 Tax=Accumulibacter sp. TaxID=2053492 RepID=UPI00287A1248|nr:hypothetical protein [Accumulibacter sp.]MDS4014871.1 hypothetical protein [Accumulibacter sp.]
MRSQKSAGVVLPAPQRFSGVSNGSELRWHPRTTSLTAKAIRATDAALVKVGNLRATGMANTPLACAWMGNRRQGVANCSPRYDR